MEISYLSSEQNLRQTLIGRTQTKGTIMKIAVVAANGREGQLVVKEAVERGHDVTAVVRGDNKTVAKNVVVKDLFNLTAADLAGFDVVVDAFGAWTPEMLPQHSSSLKHLCDILSGVNTRLIVVGGAGSLYVNPEHTTQLKDERRARCVAQRLGDPVPPCANVPG